MIDDEKNGLAFLKDKLGIPVAQLKQLFLGKMAVQRKPRKTFKIIYQYPYYPTRSNMMHFTVRAGKVSSILFLRECIESEIILLIKEYKNFFMSYGYELKLDEDRHVLLETVNLSIEITHSSFYGNWEIQIESTYKNSNIDNKKVKVPMSLTELINSHPKLKDYDKEIKKKLFL